MDINSAFPGDYLKAADLQGRRVRVEIEGVNMEKIQEEEKPVCYFKGKQKGLVLNKTNANMIVEAAGGDSETNNWTGLEIILYSTKVDFQGRRVDAIRVDAVPTNNRKKSAPKTEEDFSADDLPEDAPF